MESAAGALYPNLYIMLTSPPGVGKSQILNHLRRLWMGVGDLKVAPDSMTKAAMVDILRNSGKSFSVSPQQILIYHPLQIIAPEFGILLAAQDLSFLAHLNGLFDGMDEFDEKRRSRSAEEQTIIQNPLINLIGGVQPKFMQTLFPDEAWGMGTTSRMIFVEASIVPEVKSMFTISSLDPKKFARLLAELRHLSTIFARFHWTPEAIALADDWRARGHEPLPTHSKLESYVVRREANIFKLAMVASISRHRPAKGQVPTIERADLLRAMSWLFDAEARMPDIFKLMSGKSDHAILEQLHMWAFREQAKNGGPTHYVPQRRVYDFLSTHMPVDKVKATLDIAVKSGLLEETAMNGTPHFRPRAIETRH